MKSKDLKRVSLLSIVDKDRAHQHYMELSSAYSDLAITKIVHDNNIKFTVPELTYVFFDIETYSTERDFNGVPSHEYSHCHISTVQLLIIKGSVERRIIFVNDQGSYVYDQSKVEGTQVVMLKDEERVARAFFSLLRDIGHCIALSYNGSADVYGRSTQYDFKTIGYDLPWLIQRSRQSWKPQTKTFKNKYLAGSGASMSWSQCISSIEQLPMVKFIDV
jgi:DNA polymerase elongation subunit (family B)